MASVIYIFFFLTLEAGLSDIFQQIFLKANLPNSRYCV